MTESQFGESVKFFSDRHPDQDKRTGLNVQYTLTRSNEPTVSIEVAPIARAGEPPSWADKITIQLTRPELTGLCSVLFELRKEVSGAYHGQARNKSISAYANGPKGAAITVAEQGRQLHHMLTPDSRLELAVFVVRRLSMAWKVTPADTIALLRQAVRMQ